jgi:hypothetical protein
MGYALLLLFLLRSLVAQENAFSKVVVISVLLALLLFITIRLLFNYKIIIVSKGKIIVRYKLVAAVRKFDLQDLKNVDEIRIKTFNSTEHRKLVMLFPHDKVSINSQVYLNYNKLKECLFEKKQKKKSKK